MKWLGEGDSEMLSQSNGPQQVQQQAPSQVNAEASRPQTLSRSQDDAMVGYVFQRPQADPDFPVPPTFKQQSRWPVTDDTVIDHNQEKWKYPVAKMPMSVNNVPFEVHPLVMKPGSEHFLYHHMTQPPPPMAGVLPPDMNPRNGQIAPSAKKLWGVDEPKDEPKGILSLNDHQMWRDSTWSTSEHAVSQPITMVARRSGSFPGSEAGNILSPRSSETSGLGVKMVEYVLGTSPTNKDLEPQMRRLVLTSNDPNDKKEKEKAPSSPYDTAQKKEHENGVVPQNGVQNGLDDDKGFNRTPGSRQPSPSDEELNKNNGVVVLENPHSHVGHHYPHPFPPPPHPHTLAHLDSHFEHVMALDPGSFAAADGGQQQGYSAQTQQQPQQHTQTQAMDSPTVLSTSFDVQDEPLMPKTLQEKDVSSEPCGSNSERMASTLQKELNSHSTSKMRPQPRQTSPTKNMFKKSQKPTRFETNLNKLEKIATLATTDPDDEYEKYGRHIAAQLRAMPLRSFIILQREINNLISAERLHFIDSGSPSYNFTTDIQRPSSSSTHSSMSFEPMETNINRDSQFQLSDECGDLLNKALIGICSPTSNDSM